jgi:hypothetical protein
VIWEAAPRLEGGLIDLLSRWRIDVAFLPINGRDYFRAARGIVGNTDFREAAELAEALDVSLVVPTHYDLFTGNAADPGHFVSYLHRLNPARGTSCCGGRAPVLRQGELLIVVLGGAQELEPGRQPLGHCPCLLVRAHHHDLEPLAPLVLGLDPPLGVPEALHRHHA